MFYKIGWCRCQYNHRSMLLLLIWICGLCALMQLCYSLTTTVKWQDLHKPKNLLVNRHRELNRSNFTTSDAVPAPISHASLSETEPNVKLLRGVHRSSTGFLTIGLCTVPRRGISYLLETIRSLTQNILTDQRDKVVIVIYLGNFNASWVNKTLTDIDREFSNELITGLIHVVQPLPDVYPNFSKITKRTFDDTLERVHWRTKQNIDYAYTFSYSKNISTYYIHVEDDVISADRFVNEIHTFVQKYNNRNINWFCIEFSELGFIGKLFHSSDLYTIKHYLLLFKTKKPCDLLIDDMKKIMLQNKSIRSSISVFQHKGFVSSLEGKVQTLTDTHFKDAKRQYENFLILKSRNTSNPEASIKSSISTFDNFKPEFAYMSSTKGFFWGKNPAVGDTFQIIFKNTTKVKEIHIKTGHPKKPDDILRYAILKLGKRLDKNNNCDSMSEAGSFVNGELHALFNETPDTKCAVICITGNQGEWLIITDIQVIT